MGRVARRWSMRASAAWSGGAASERRRFFDRLVLAIDSEHSSRVSALERSLRSRNRLLEVRNYDDHWCDAIERETAETLVAESEGRVAGYAMVLFRKGSGVARLYSIATGPDFTGRGIGRILLEAAENTAFEHGRMMLRLEVREDNPRARRLYERFGFEHIHTRRGYYRDGVSALVMRLTL